MENFVAVVSPNSKLVCEPLHITGLKVYNMRTQKYMILTEQDRIILKIVFVNNTTIINTIDGSVIMYK